MAQTTTPPEAAPPSGAQQQPPAATATATPPKDSGKYKLLAPHALADQVLPMGTEVGTDTPYRFPGTPSNQMEGLDGPGKAAVDKLFQDLYGAKPPWESDDPVAKAHIAQYTGDPEAAKKDAASEPCSMEQAFEKGAKEFPKGKPLPAKMPPPPLPMPVSGDRSVYVGTARMF